MSDGPGAGQWDEGWKGPRHEYTGFRTRDPVVWSRVFYRSTKRTALVTMKYDVFSYFILSGHFVSVSLHICYIIIWHHACVSYHCRPIIRVINVICFIDQTDGNYILSQYLIPSLVSSLEIDVVINSYMEYPTASSDLTHNQPHPPPPHPPVRLKFGFRPLKVISPTASLIRRCMQVYIYVGSGIVI